MLGDRGIPTAGDQIALDLAQRRRRIGAASALLIAAITVLRFVANSAEEPITVLYVIPIAVAAAEFGIRAGIGVALLCFGLFQAAVLVADVQATLLDDVIRLAIFVSVGAVVGWVGLRLRSALEDVERSSVIMRTVGEATPDVIYAKDSAGRYTLMNTAGARFLGRTPAEVIGRFDEEIMDAEDARVTREHDQRAIERDEIIETHLTLRLEDGERSFDGYLGPLRSGDGELIGLFGVARDVTAQRRTEATRAVYLRATQLVAEAPEPEGIGSRLLEILADGTVIRSGRLVEPGGAAPEEGPLTAVLPLCGGGRDFGTLVLDVAGDGDEGASGRTLVRGVGAVVEQYLERRVAEREAERLKNEFFGMISHELRSPLTSIVGYTELLAEIEAENLSDQGRGFIEVIDRNARRQLRLVQDLLLLVRLEGGRFDLERAIVDLRSVVSDACDAVGPQARAKGIELAADLAEVGEADVDSVRLGQAVDNLLTNAIKFSPDGGRVEVRLSAADRVATIEVADSGIGVSEDEVEHLFDRLFRASSAVEQQIQGTGLGLTIVKAVTEAHGGEVTVESELGRGTTFTLTLPVLTDEEGGRHERSRDLEGQVR